MRLAALAMLAACGSTPPPPPPDAALPSPFTYDFGVGMDRPGRNLGLVVLIDGVATTNVSATYDASQTGMTIRHHVELRYLDIVLATLDARDVLSCAPLSGSLISYSTGIIELDSGDLRPAATDVDCTDGGFAGDSFGNPNCNCGSGEHCEPRITLDSPRFTRMACAPVGPKLDGDACSFTPDVAGAYDDCGSGLFCFEGTCHGLCMNNAGSPPVLGPEYPNDVTLCD